MSPVRPTSLRARLAKAGLDPDRAVPRLEAAGLVALDDVDPQLLELLSEAAEPQDALLCLTELAEQHPDVLAEVRGDAAWLARVVAVAGTSRPLGDLLARHPEATEALRTLDGVDVAATADAVTDAVAAEDDVDAQAAGIARIRRAATADIAARDLTGVDDVEAVARELANLAEAVLSGTLRGVHQQLTGGEPSARIAVIGMGKLGGRELNYVSDVDVVFVHEPVEGAQDEDAGREARQVLTRLLELLNASTTMGRAYEVDPTLRPEGRTGPLSRTIASFVTYWERWAKTWEFQALLKARPVAGDHALGEELLHAAEPFVWPEHLDPDVVAEVRAMKARIEAKPEVQRHKERQLKLGPGGIRDVEFSVQLLQLVHGRGDRSLRIAGTLPALAALTRNGYVDEEDAQAFASAYRLLRTAEHRLQLAHERRTHTIPDDPARQEWLARAMGYRPDGDAPAREAFTKDLNRVQVRVRELHAKLFYRPLLEAQAALPAADAGVSLPTEVRRMGDDAARERLAALGFSDAAQALRHVRRLTAGVSRRARTVRAVLPNVLQVLQDTPDPDAGLAAFRDLVDKQGETTELLAHLRDHPPAAEMLARVVGTSPVAGELLVGQPRGVELLRDSSLREAPRTRETLVRTALARLTWQDTTAALRRFKRLELLRLVVRDLAGATTVSGVGEELTHLGEACLEGALSDELRRRARALGLSGVEELPVRVAIVGMGKLGGRELHYVSDLDVLFVHEAREGADEKAASKLALEIAGEVMRSLSAITADGTAFEVDADLRPEGRNGPLSRSAPSYESYWQRWAQPWEHQALLKARHAAGDEDLGARFVARARELAYPEDFGEREVAQMRRMKARLERERIPKRLDASRHLKLGPGGLSDVEWTVQLLQQRHGARSAAARGTSTMGVLDALQDADFVGHRDAGWLREGYLFLSELRNRMYLRRVRDVDVLPTATHQLEVLARAMGYGRGGWQELEEDRRRHARHVRQVCERVFYGQDGGTW
ncbi:bifunctional [glutamine synthetase] adenylyltransferase/[glutamine synthetase]-adenylyl-L-tyrosine phosphorylase [Nitriliruptoraceae bacterium ZYF776]|nr:bifunctional [glutamine synthetase] adenylyltransferase/[glutamine synthetase]-adenylyl-L-tyrosine phosphorylase [Profundirhabdus halotolerans]